MHRQQAPLHTAIGMFLVFGPAQVLAGRLFSIFCFFRMIRKRNALVHSLRRERYFVIVMQYRKLKDCPCWECACALRNAIDMGFVIMFI
jgi:hypothetical protein